MLIDAERDGIRKITDTLAEEVAISTRSTSSATPRDGAVQLGSSELDFETLVKRAAAIKKLGRTRSPRTATSCSTAAIWRPPSEGQSLMEALSRLTGADVAACEDPTGAAAKGGDWELEFKTGAIEAPVARQPARAA